jgi:hypothetical protein
MGNQDRGIAILAGDKAGFACRVEYRYLDGQRSRLAQSFRIGNEPGKGRFG